MTTTKQLPTIPEAVRTNADTLKPKIVPENGSFVDKGALFEEFVGGKAAVAEVEAAQKKVEDFKLALLLGAGEAFVDHMAANPEVQQVTGRYQAGNVTIEQSVSRTFQESAGVGKGRHTVYGHQRISTSVRGSGVVVDAIGKNLKAKAAELLGG